MSTVVTVTILEIICNCLMYYFIYYILIKIKAQFPCSLHKKNGGCGDCVSALHVCPASEISQQIYIKFGIAVSTESCRGNLFFIHIGTRYTLVQIELLIYLWVGPLSQHNISGSEEIFYDMTPCSPLSANQRFRNVGWHSTDYTASYPRRWYSS
jgi:hypothetical protein